MSRIVHDGPAVYVNADLSAVVDGDSPEAAILLVAAGGTVRPHLVDVYRRLVAVVHPVEKPKTVAYGTPDPVVAEPAATTKPRRRAARKSDD